MPVFGVKNTRSHRTTSPVRHIPVQSGQRVGHRLRHNRFGLGRRGPRTAAAAFLLATLFLAPPAQAALLGLRQTGTGATQISALPGESVSLDLFLDTGGFTFEGYVAGLDFTGGLVTGTAVAHQALGLVPDPFGAPIIDDAAGTIRNINQATFGSGLAAGEYVLDTITFTMGTPVPGSSLVVTPGLFSEVLGLGSGSCPGTTVGCTVSFSSVVVPEPGAGLLLIAGLSILHAGTMRRRLAAGRAGLGAPWTRPSGVQSLSRWGSTR